MTLTADGITQYMYSSDSVKNLYKMAFDQGFWEEPSQTGQSILQDSGPTSQNDALYR